MDKLISRELLASYDEGQIVPIKENMLTLAQSFSQLNDVALTSQSSIITLKQAVKNLEDEVLSFDTTFDTRVTATETAITNRYTKTETDEKIAEAIDDVAQEHFHVVTALPDPLDADINARPKENHEYVIVTYEDDGTTITTEEHYLFYDGVYHQRPTHISFEGYATEQYVNTEVGKKADFSVTQMSVDKYVAEITQGTDVFRIDEPTSDLVDMKWVDTSATHTNTVQLPTKNYVDDAIENIPQATDTKLGVVKLNLDESVNVNADGQLVIGGRLGQYPDGGVYYPTDIAPTGVGLSSFLITDGAKGAYIYGRTFAIMAGANITCKSAVAGSTEYRISNTYANRFTCFAAKGGRAALNKNDAVENGTVQITSIKFANGQNISAHFGANENSNDIIITLSKTVNPNVATTSIRLYGTNMAEDNILVGQCVGASNGKAISLGQATYAGGNQTVAIGNSVHVMDNNSVGMGHTMLVNKQYCLGAGQGHDFTSGANGTTAVGTWSQIKSNTKFVVGNGADNLNRSNIFEVTNDSGQTGVIMKSPNGSKWKLQVDNNGNLTTVAVS